MTQLVTTTIILLPKRDVLHKPSGLIMKYISEYKPANDITSITVSIPMVGDMCYLIPRKAMIKIPQCNTNIKQQQEEKNDTSNKRNKRFIMNIISIAMGTAATMLATSNTIQIHNLQKEIKSIRTSIDSIQNAVNSHHTQLFQLTKGQITIVEELIHTQTALNNTIVLVNEHSNVLKQHRVAINTLVSMVMMLKKELTSFTHAVETHFIHESIEDILANKLNLRFIHHYDLPRVIRMITKQVNIDMEETDDSLPTFELINRLLIQQRIEFVPINTKEQTAGGAIGNLLFISFFATANKNQQSFSTYQLTPIPFNQGQQRLKLAQTPYIIGISTKTMELIQWTKEESNTCKFTSMSSCRETPPINKNWKQTCLFEILTDSKLTLCRIEHELEPIFIQRVGQQWAISTINETKCHRVTQLEQGEHAITTNNELTIPPIALITIDKSTAWSCDNFFLPSMTNGTNKFITIIENKKLNFDDSILIDLQKAMSNDTRWEKIPYIPGNIKNMIEYLITTTPTTIVSPITWYQHGLAIGLLSIGIIAITLIILYMRLIGKIRKTSTTKMIIMPQI